MSNQEIWKPVPIKIWRNRYEVSNLGRVRSIWNERLQHAKNGRLRVLYREKSGYLRIHLFKGNSRKRNRIVQRFGVHQLVALAFVGPRPSKNHTVNHQDENIENNRWDNLKWMTFAKNTRYSAPKLTEARVEEFRKRVTNGELPTKIAAEFGISFGYACAIARGEKWKIIK